MANPSSKRMVATGRVTIGSRQYDLAFSVPQEPVALDAMLPLYRSLTDMMTSIARADSEAAGKPCSCFHGCTSCCHQLIPLTETEARSLPAVVAGLPASLHDRVQAGFDRARKVALDAGLLERMQALAALSPPQRLRLGFDYLRVRIACPFLVDGSCAIYEQRPLRCREHMVSSQPSHCETPADGSVQPIATRVSISAALQRLEAADSGRRTGFVALLCAEQWARDHPQAPPPKKGPEHVQELLALLSGNSGPDTGTNR